jgi:hypothetical protein
LRCVCVVNHSECPFEHSAPGAQNLFFAGSTEDDLVPLACALHAHGGADALSDVERFFVPRMDAGESAEPEIEDESQAFPDATPVCD